MRLRKLLTIPITMTVSVMTIQLLLAGHRLPLLVVSLQADAEMAGAHAGNVEV